LPLRPLSRRLGCRVLSLPPIFSPDMIERARERLGGAPNVTVRVEDGQALEVAGLVETVFRPR
jgi:hypothetical protein